VPTIYMCSARGELRQHNPSKNFSLSPRG
jgi:hypothetical protein